jgi:hypothetical protein
MRRLDYASKSFSGSNKGIIYLIDEDGEEIDQ